jgi:4'-phosphopantetheinyl transferase
MESGAFDAVADDSAVPTLLARSCQIWWARAHDVRPEHDSLLDEADLERRSHLARESDRLRSTAAWVVARLVLATQLGRDPADLRMDRTCAACGAPHGKPRLVDGEGLHFSVSHSADLVAVAVTRVGPVGVDIEQVAPWHEADLDEVAELTLAPVERAVLARQRTADKALAFTTYWTRKEAAVKAVGTGLTAPLEEIVVSPPASPPRLVRWGRNGHRLPMLYALGAPVGVVGALAVLDGGPVRVVEKDAADLLRAAQSSRRLSSVTIRSQRYP